MRQLLLYPAIFLLSVACRKPPPPPAAQAYVECKSAGQFLASGMACTIEHRQGVRPIHACWAMKIACVNGTRGQGRGCGDVQPMAKSSSFMPYAAFGGALDKCDQVATASVEDMTLEER